MITFNHVIFYLICLCSRSGGHLPSRFNRDKARPYVGALVVADLPTTYQMIQTSDSITHSILDLINNMLIDLLATMARLDNEKRIERIKQGLARSGYKPTGKKANEAKHKRIKELLAAGNMTKEEIAKAVNCGVATVYRVAKVI